MDSGILPLVNSIVEIARRQHGAILFEFQSLHVPKNITQAQRRQLSGALAKRYVDEKYGTLGSARAAASQHAKAIWGISNSLGDPSCRTIEAYINSLIGPLRTSSQSYPAPQLIKKSVQDLLCTLPPIHAEQIKIRYRMAPYVRQVIGKVDHASWATVSDLTGVSLEECKSIVERSIRKLRHPSRTDLIKEILEMVARFPPDTPEELLLCDIAKN